MDIPVIEEKCILTITLIKFGYRVDAGVYVLGRPRRKEPGCECATEYLCNEEYETRI